MDAGSQARRRSFCHQGPHQVSQAPLARSLLCAEGFWPGEFRENRRESEKGARRHLLPRLCREAVCTIAISWGKSEGIPHVRRVSPLILEATTADRFALSPTIGE